MKKEPVLIVSSIIAIVQATIQLLIVLGVPISAEVNAAIMSLLTVLGGIIARAYVTPVSEDPPTKKTPPTAAAVVFAIALFFLPGCGAMGPLVASLIDVAESGADLYYARHPNAEADRVLSALLFEARQATAAYNANPNPTTKEAMLMAYERVRGFLDSAGVLDARAPDGGAESEAPKPEPFTLPSRESIE